MKLREVLHRSKTHAKGYDPACPECVRHPRIHGACDYGYQAEDRYNRQHAEPSVIDVTTLAAKNP